jgi:hypothetical protein
VVSSLIAQRFDHQPVDQRPHEPGGGIAALRCWSGGQYSAACREGTGHLSGLSKIRAIGAGSRRAGCGITTVPAALASVIPPGVRSLPVRGGPAEQRRILLARVPGPLPEPVARLAAAIETDSPA